MTKEIYKINLPTVDFYLTLSSIESGSKSIIYYVSYWNSYEYDKSRMKLGN